MSASRPHHKPRAPRALHDRAVDRTILADALAAAGNPDCWFANVLDRCEACTGACGLDTEVPVSREFAMANGCLVVGPGPVMWPAQCGQKELESVVEDLIRECEHRE